MPKVLSIQQSYSALCNALDKWGKAFYLRFGDIDIFFMTGRNYKTGQPLTKSYGNNKSRWSKKFQAALVNAFKVKHPKFLKAVSGQWPMEKGMTNRVFGPFGYSKTFSNMVTELSDEGNFYHPWLFQYLAVFEPVQFESFLDKYVRYKRKMFIGSADRDAVERVIGKVDFFIETPPHNSFSKIDEWYPKIENILLQEKEKGQAIPVIILNTGQASRVLGGMFWNNNNIGGHFLDFGSLFNAVAGIKDRWWIKEKGENVRIRFAPKKFEHYVLTRFNIGKGNDIEYLENRLAVFEKYTLPSLKAQTNQNFAWLLLFDEHTSSKYYEHLRKYKNIVIVKTHEPYDNWQKAFRNWIYAHVDWRDLQYLITSRIDNDDIYHPEYIDTVQKSIFTKSVLFDPLGYQYDAENDAYFTADKYHADYSSPFISLIEKIDPKQKPKTVVFADHNHMKKHFPLMKYKHRMYVQVVHGDNARNIINGQAVDQNPNFLMIHADPEFLKMFHKIRAEEPYFRNRINYLSEVHNMVKELNSDTILEIGPDALQMFEGSDTLDIDPKLDDITYVQDITKVPWEIDKHYDLIVALQVWEHLEGAQVLAFAELQNHCDKAILSFPYNWQDSDEMHTGIDEERILEWTGGIEPVSSVIIKDVNERIVCLYDFRVVIESEEDNKELEGSGSGENTPSLSESKEDDLNLTQVAPEKDPFDIVIPLGHGSQWDDNELKYALRSIEKNYPDHGKVVIIAEKGKVPEWLLPSEELIVLEHQRGPSVHYENYLDTRHKLHCAIFHPEISDTFLWMYDDQVLLKEISGEDLFKLYHDCLLSDEFLSQQKGRTKWWNTVRAAYKELKPLLTEVYSFENHLPRLFNKDLLKSVIEISYDKVPPALPTLYYNLLILQNELNHDNISPANTVRAYIHDKKKSLNPDKITEGKTFLSYDDSALSDEFKTWLADRFPEKSKFEN